MLVMFIKLLVIFFLNFGQLLKALDINPFFVFYEETSSFNPFTKGNNVRIQKTLFSWYNITT